MHINQKVTKYKKINFDSSIVMDIDIAHKEREYELWNNLLMLFYVGSSLQEEYTPNYINRLLEKYY